MKFCVRGFLLVLISFYLAPIFSPVTVAAGPEKDIQSQIEQEKTELEKLRAKLKKRERAIKKAGKKENSVLMTLQKMSNQLKLKERELKIYQWNKKINQKKIIRLEQKIALADTHLAGQKKILGKRLRAIYKEGSMFPIKVLFSAENFNDLIQRVKYMELVTEYDSRIFGKYNARLNQLEEEKSALLNARAKLDQLERNTKKK